MPEGKVEIGVTHFPPLVLKNGENFKGFEIELWKKIAAEIDLDYSFRQYEFADLLPALAQNKIDGAFGGITITEEREKGADFSHSIFESGLVIAVRKKESSALLALLKSVASKEAVDMLGIFLATVFVSAHVIWYFERNGGGTLSGPYFPGIFNAAWWSMVTMATIGYGDYSPVTGAGRVAAAVIIVFGLAIFGLFIGAISSSLMSRKFTSDISSHEDLKGKSVATVADSTSVNALKELGATVIAEPKITDAFAKLERDEVQAVVFDAPVLLHYCANDGKDKIRVVGDMFRIQNYGIALRSGSVIREKINGALLKFYEDGRYDALYKKWFNKDRTSEHYL